MCFITLFLFSSPLPFSLPFFMSFKFFHVFQFGQKSPPPKGGESVNVRKKSLLDPFRNGLGSRIEGPHMFCMYISSLSKTRDMKQTVTDIPYKDKFTWYFYPLGKYSLTWSSDTLMNMYLLACPPSALCVYASSSSACVK